MDWTIRKIQEIAKAKPLEVTRPESYKNPLAKDTCPRDQYMRGTCVGQSGAYLFDILHLKLRPDDMPTDADKAAFKKDVVDSLGTSHDILYPISASAECVYQVSRKLGNITYPSGSDTRFGARALIQYGMNLESQWHTDKLGTKVWMDEPRQTSDGGLSPADAQTYAALHRAEGWALLGDPSGNTSWDEVCDNIYKYGMVWGAIPVYTNYVSMQGGDGSFPDPDGDIDGYHALCFYGYDTDRLYFLHSWGDWCGRFGSISKRYFQYGLDESVYLVIIDSADAKIAREYYKSLTVTVKDNVTKGPLPAQVSVDGVYLGIAPQKFAIEPGKTYEIDVSYTGYISQKKYADDSQEEVLFQLDPIPPDPETENWFRKLVNFLKWLYWALFVWNPKKFKR